jgi:hypothetical protein
VNRRVLAIVLLAAAVLGVGVYLLTGTAPKPAPADTTAAPRSEPATAPPPAPPPAPEAKAPVETPRSAESRRRPATPAPAPAATPEVATAPAADAAMLKIDVDVPDAQVFVDRVFLGKAPLTTTDVKPGSHRLNVSAAGYEGVAQSIDVKPGMQQVTVKLREVRLDASIDVVHKHRMGSCKGRLIATPQGMRYDTTDKDDAFKTTLLDIDTFEVDYLKKNLRIKLKQGKQYDFTDPEGNADRLFVFHRDVDKARERLKKGDTPASE